MINQKNTFFHPLAVVESPNIGDSTKIWAFAHVMPGARIGADCNIGGGSFIESGAVVGDRVTIKNQVLVWNGVTIGDDCFVGPGVLFTNDLRPRSPRMQRCADRYKMLSSWLSRTQIDVGATLGAGCTILPVSVGKYAMVGAGSVVTKDVPPHGLVRGNPAKIVGWVCFCGQRLDHTLVCNMCGSDNSEEIESAKKIL